ncbi:MAG: hypothetical protein GY724_10290 [Actinomycetia bacterium]|nr:hypothetical protein [Actinomycetes bacterium]MCP5035826.1 hypothetical protein [Actinomycetes bacterium]
MSHQRERGVPLLWGLPYRRIPRAAAACRVLEIIFVVPIPFSQIALALWLVLEGFDRSSHRTGLVPGADHARISDHGCTEGDVGRGSVEGAPHGYGLAKQLHSHQSAYAVSPKLGGGRPGSSGGVQR